MRAVPYPYPAAECRHLLTSGNKYLSIVSGMSAPKFDSRVFQQNGTSADSGVPSASLSIMAGCMSSLLGFWLRMVFSQVRTLTPTLTASAMREWVDASKMVWVSLSQSNQRSVAGK